MIAEILTIGDEGLRGEIVDSNKAYLAEQLLTLDIECHYQVSVRDNPADMEDAFRRATERSDVVLVSGGLGPTRDDLTTKVLAATFGRPLVLDEDSLEVIRAFFRRVGREMSENNAKQAYFPKDADVLANPEGTAPGFMIEVERTAIFCLPGVPRELRRMMEEQVLTRLAKRSMRRGAGVSRSRLLRTFGIGESSLDRELEDLAADSDLELGFRTAFPDNYLRPVARGATAEEAEARLEELVGALRKRLGPLIYGEGDERMPMVVGRLLRERGLRLAVAESCTGGAIAEQVTSVPGSSEFFSGGVVAYSNSSKSALLGVSSETIETVGAVSEPVVRAMAEGVRERFGADLGLATTGISGPGGGSEEKPVGLVHVGLSAPEGVHCDQFIFALDRARHRVLTAQVGLDWVRRSLQGFELVGPSLMRRGGASAPGSGGSPS
ncbi:MAG: competence/damage-inducible protein A [Myxococcota bacterium]|nr:competence/damage-inducible protein A [Myxococcota bacterium]